LLKKTGRAIRGLPKGAVALFDGEVRPIPFGDTLIMTDTAETMESVEPVGAAAATETVDAAVPPTEAADDALNAALDANDEIKNHVIAAMAVGLLPIPGVDMAGMLAVQVRMVDKICKIYGVTLRENAARASILSLAGGLLPATLASGFVSGLKVIPGFGSLTGAAGASLLGGAMTYAIGKVFHEHLETHESLIDFDPTKARVAMRREFDNGVNFARSLRSKVTSKIVTKGKPDSADDAPHLSPEMEPAAA
jgi:uncharacterized protein (DUF697 family)